MHGSRLIANDAEREPVALPVFRSEAGLVQGDESEGSVRRVLPAVIILNLSYSGLAIARSLRRKNIRILGLSSNPGRAGNFTRCCQVQIAPDSQERPAELLSFMMGLTQEFAGAVVFPTRDADVVFLDRFRKELSSKFRLCLPSKSSLASTLNKKDLACVARQAGVPTPNTIAVHCVADLGRVPEEVGFPCVVKPVSSVDWRSSQSWAKAGCRKAFLANDAEQLRREYEQVSLAHPCVLIQEWVPGPTENIVVVGAYVNENSEPIEYFTARKLLQSPDDFGTGCVVASEDIPELLEPSRVLWKALQYRGLAEIEYKQDNRTGEYRLIEINTRHWDQHQLGEATGTNLTWTAYCDLAGLEVAVSRRPYRRIKWVAEDAVILYVLQTALGRPRSTVKLLKFLKGRRMYAVFAWYDPGPLLHYIVCGLLPFLGRSLWKRITRG